MVLEPLDAVGAEAVVAIEVVGDEAVGAAADAGLDPRLEHRPPVRIIEAGPVLLHPADGVLVVDDRLAVRAALQQVQQVIGRPRAELLLVPEVAEELEEAARPVRAVGVADEELDVEVADDLDTAAMQLGVEILEPAAAFGPPLHGEVSGIALALGRVGEAPEMPAVEADLHDLGLGIIDERKVSRVGVLGPVGDQPRKFDARRLGRCPYGASEGEGDRERCRSQEPAWGDHEVLRMQAAIRFTPGSASPPCPPRR